MSHLACPVIETRSYPDHVLSDRHEFHQLLLGVSGVVELEVDGRAVRVGSGVVAPVASGAMHHYLAPGDNDILVLDLPQAWCQELALERLFTSSVGSGWRLPPALVKEASRLSRHTAHSASATRDVPSNETLVGWLSAVDRYLGVSGSKGSAPPRLRLLRLLPALRADLAYPWKVAEMAAMCHLAEAVFARQFRTLTGVAPYTWLMRERLALARQRMQDSLASLTDIALACGFHDSAHFSRSFRQQYGCSPRQWRARRQK
uniref:AraC family transcriptional regulator n=1 Tax=Halomonas sp. TaxID=1486246 RepID=UPI0026176B8E|nr:AraC family transcriptional regulator [Halomonas sp.]